MISLRHVSAALVIAVASPAYANPFDVLGLGSRRAGVAGAGLASVDDMAAVYYDPAGLVLRRDSEVALGVAGAYSHLAINGVREPFSDGGGLQLGMRAHLHRRFAVGVAVHSAPRGTLLVVRDPATPYYPQLRDALSRSAVLVGAAADLRPVAIGASFDVLDGFEHARAIVGATYTLGTIRLGAVYHQRFALPAGTARLHYSPHEVAVGIAYTDGLVASFDLGWAHWSAYKGPFAVDRVDYDDTFSVRFGIESGTEGLISRAGYSFEDSPVDTLPDGGKHTVAFGGGYVLDKLRVDAHVAVEIVATRTLDDPARKSGGEVFSAGLTLTTGF